MFKATLGMPEVGYISGGVIARLYMLDGDYREWYDAADQNKEYDVDIRPHRERRSLDANAYYHVLLNKMAKAMGVSMAEVKNATLGRYGQLELVDDKPVEFLIPDDARVERRTDIHLQPTADVEFNRGRLCRWYRVVRGSRTYNTAEFSALLTGTISDARDAGLTDAEIMTPSERSQLEEVYGVRL